MIRAVLLLLYAAAVQGFTVSWPATHSQLVLPNLQFQIRQDDYETILADTTFDIYKPAAFWGELDGVSSTPILC